MPDDVIQDAGDRKQHWLLAGVAACLAAGLVLYSQTIAFTWDEGFHMLAAMLINLGKRPYLDFFHPQTPLYAYWNAAWMRVFGQGWRMPHLISALLTALAVWLAADFVFRKLTDSAWRFAAALAAALLVGLNAEVVQYGTIGQPYALCLFAAVAAFRLSVLAAGKPGWFLPAMTGFFAGVGAASSLLIAPIGPVLLIWMLWYSRSGSRWAKCGAFLAGGAIPFLPLFWLFALSPGMVFFEAVKYHLLYRRVDWDGTTAQNLDVISAWLESSQALLLGLLAVIGYVYIAADSGWDRTRRAEFYLCGWLGVAEGLYLCTPQPTFQRYFLLVTPFFAIPAAVGLYAIGSRVLSARRPFWPALALAVVLVLGLAKSLYEEKDRYRWPDFERMAQKVREVTPPGGTLAADEIIYFLLHRVPPVGFEYADTHKLDLPAPREAALHIIPTAQLDKGLKSGMYFTISTCDDDDRIDDLGLKKLYPHEADFDGCYVFWGKVHAPAAGPSLGH